MAFLDQLFANSGGLFGNLPPPNSPEWEAIRRQLAESQGAAPQLRYDPTGPDTMVDLRTAGGGFGVAPGPSRNVRRDQFGRGAEAQSLYGVDPSGFGFQPPVSAPDVAATTAAQQPPVALLENRPPMPSPLPPELVQPTDIAPLPVNARPTAGSGLPAVNRNTPQTPTQYRTSAPPQQQPQYQPPGSPDFGDRLQAGFANFGTGGNLIGAISNSITGLQTGQRLDPVGAYNQAAAQTYRALLDNGVPEPQARLAATNPEAQRQILASLYAQPKFEKLGPGDTGVLVGGGGLGGGGAGGLTPVVRGMGLEQSEEAKKIGQSYATQYGDIQTAAGTAVKQLNTLARLRQLSDLAPSGAGAPAYQHARSLLTTMGIAPNSVKAGEEFNALSNKLVLDAAGGTLGTGFSNADRDYLSNTVPTLSQSAAGRSQLIDTMQKVAQRNIQMAQLADQYRHDNGSMAGFTTIAARYAEANPIFGPPSQGPGSRPISVGSPAEAARLPRGTRFIDPNGVTRMVP